MKGRKPLWPESLWRRYGKPAVRKAGISKRVGWHTFGHSYATLLKDNGEDIKVVQELLRHANAPSKARFHNLRSTALHFSNFEAASKRVYSSTGIKMRVQFMAALILGLTLSPAPVFCLYVRCTTTGGQDCVRIAGLDYS